jgi:hypothetical protein
VSWGSISGYIVDQLDLISYLSTEYYPSSNPSGFQTASDVSTYVGANAYPLTGNPSGFLTSVPAKTVNDVSATAPYTLQLSDNNNIVYTTNTGEYSAGIAVPADDPYGPSPSDFPIGATITIVSSQTANPIVSAGLAVASPYPYVNGGSGGAAGSTVVTLVKVSGNTWFFA